MFMPIINAKEYANRFNTQTEYANRIHKQNTQTEYANRIRKQNTQTELTRVSEPETLHATLLLYIKLYTARGGAYFLFRLIRETGKTLNRWPMPLALWHVSKHNWPNFGRAMGSSKSVLSVAAAVFAGPPVPESAMGKVNEWMIIALHV
jgi:hypothetical protein